MFKPNQHQRTVSAVILGGCLSLLAGCEQWNGGRPEIPGAPAQVIASSTEDTLIVQMTGQLLVVPPAVAGRPVTVVLPSDPAHVSWLGFGMSDDSAYAQRGLCEGNGGQPGSSVTDVLGDSARRHHICYVDLSEWNVESIGAGGLPTIAQARPLPNDLYDVTRASGGEHIVKRPSGPARRGTVEFRAGEPKEWCGLAEWRIGSLSGGSGPTTFDTDTLINRLDWHIRGNFPRKLYFARKNGGVRDSATLASGSGAAIRIILAQIPESDLPSLPPWDEYTGPGSTTAHHVGSFFNVVQHRTTNTTLPSPPPLPTFSERLRTRCNASISLLDGDTATAALTSYACVIGTADGS